MSPSFKIVIASGVLLWHPRANTQINRCFPPFTTSKAVVSLNTFRFPSVTELVLTGTGLSFYTWGGGWRRSEGQRGRGKLQQIPRKSLEALGRPNSGGCWTESIREDLGDAVGFRGVWYRKGRNHESRGQSGASGGGGGIGVRARDVGVGRGGVEGWSVGVEFGW